MEELLQNETAFDIFFETLDRVKNLKTFQEELRSGNELLARKSAMYFLKMYCDD